jgi:hypothetical protein
MANRAELYRQELELFQSLFDLTGNLLNTWEKGDFSPVPSLFSAREKILKRISRCEAKIQGLSKTVNDEAEISDLSGIIDEIKRTHKKLAALDQKIKEKMEAEKNQVYSQILQVSHGRKTLQGYGPHHSDIPRYCDKRG